MWYSGHLIYYVQFDDGVQDEYIVEEVVILLHASNFDDARAKAEAYGYQGEIAHPHPVFYGEREGTHAFAGVRKVVECTLLNSKGELGEGAETTFFEYRIPNKKTFEALISGEVVDVEDIL